MRIATWNVNSVRQRLPHLIDYLAKAAPDVLCLQELKCVDESFPRAEVEAAGYHAIVHGQKGFNGVAILTRGELAPAEADVAFRLPGDESDAQARYVEAVVRDPGGPVRVASLYLPNGNPPDTDKYPYKLGFMDRLTRRAAALLADEESFVLAGDYNVIPEPRDVYDPAAWTGDALFLPETRRRFRALLREWLPLAGLPDHDHVMIGREGGIERDFAALSQELAGALQRAAAGRGDARRRHRGPRRR